MKRLSFLTPLFCAIFLVFSTGCMQSVLKGEQKVSSEAKQWLQAYSAGQTLTFKTAKGESLVLTVQARKSIYNIVEDCNKKGIKETCDQYQMESIFFTGVSADEKTALSITASRGVEQGKFFDGIDILFNSEYKAHLKASKVVYNELGRMPSEVSEADYAANMVLGERSYKDVYFVKGGLNEIYFTQKEGVIGFKYEDTDLWLLQ